MALPNITPLPPAPTRADGAADFSEKADTFVAALPPFVLQTNTLAAAINQAIIDIAASQAAAAASATAAANSASAANTAKLAAQQAVVDAGAAGAAQVTLAKAEVAAATQQAQQAQAAAVAAGSASGLGPLGQAGDVIQVKPGRAGVGYAPINQVGDILVTANPMGMPWVPANGGIRSSASLPTLAAALGRLGGQIGTTYTTQANQANQANIDVASAPGAVVGGPTRVMTVSNAVAVRYSADGGATSSVATTPAGTTVVASLAYDEATDSWLIVGRGASSAALLYISNDNGTTWTSKPLPAACSRISTDISGVWIVSPLAADTSVYRSIDSGSTWAAITTGTSATHSAISNDGKGVWCVCTTSGIRRSNDGGLTWSAVSSATSFSALSNNKSGVWFAGINASAAVGNVAKSVDNGLTWVVVNMPAAANILDIAYSMGFFFFARSVSPQLISISEQADAVLYNAPVSAVQANTTKVTATDGYVVATSTSLTTVLRSAPVFAYDSTTQFQLPDFPVARGLRAWIKAASGQYSGGNFVSSGYPTGTVTASAIDYDGFTTLVIFSATEIRRSSDKGRTWSAVKTEPVGSITHIGYMGNNNWFACGADATSGRHSSDNGATWQSVAAPPTATRGSIVVGGGGVAILFNLTVTQPYVTRDYGRTWTAVSSVVATIGSTDGNGTWVAGRSASSDATFVSRDNGLTWQTRAPVMSFAPRGLVVMQNLSVIALGNGYTRISKDFCQSWHDLGIAPTTGAGNYSAGTTGGSLVMLSLSGVIYVSRDFGATFTYKGAYTGASVSIKLNAETVMALGNSLFISPMDTWV